MCQAQKWALRSRSTSFREERRIEVEPKNSQLLRAQCPHTITLPTQGIFFCRCSILCCKNTHNNCTSRGLWFNLTGLTTSSLVSSLISYTTLPNLKAIACNLLQKIAEKTRVATISYCENNLAIFVGCCGEGKREEDNACGPRKEQKLIMFSLVCSQPFQRNF